MLFHVEYWLGRFVILQGIQTNVAKKPYSFVIFCGGGGVVLTPCPPLDPRMRLI